MGIGGNGPMSTGAPGTAPAAQKVRAIRIAKTKSYDPLAPERVQEILRRLDRQYPDVTCALQHKNAWQLLVATILSAQATDVRVNIVTPELFKKYPTVEDFAALKPEQLEPDIQSTGFFRNKSKSVVGAAKKIVSDFGGQVPDEMDKLLTLPGVARKTANVTLGTTVPDLSIGLPASGGISFPIPDGYLFGGVNGCSCAGTTTSTGAVGAGIQVNLIYGG